MHGKCVGGGDGWAVSRAGGGRPGWGDAKEWELTRTVAGFTPKTRDATEVCMMDVRICLATENVKKLDCSLRQIFRLYPSSPLISPGDKAIFAGTMLEDVHLRENRRTWADSMRSVAVGLVHMPVPISSCTIPAGFPAVSRDTPSLHGTATSPPAQVQ